MGNCLVTKLKGVVQNDNLDILGAVNIEILNPTLAASHPEYLTIRTVYTETVGNYNSEKTKYTVLPSEMSDFYTLACYASPNFARINLLNLANATSLSVINIVDQQIGGNIKHLPPSLVFLSINYDGNLMDAAHLVNLTTLTVCRNINFKLSGNLEDFIAAQIQKGRTSCADFNIGYPELPSYLLSGGIYYQGVELTGGPKKVTWNWDGSSANITVTDI